MENENGAIKRQLYDLFFQWKNNNKSGNQSEHDDHHDLVKSSSGIDKKSTADRVEKEKRA